MKPIKISVDGHFKQNGPDHSEIECDDAAVIYSNINGAVIGASRDGGLHRKVVFEQSGDAPGL